MPQKASNPETPLARQIAALFDLTLEELKTRWRSLYRCATPRRSSKQLLISGIAYRIQERALGGLKPSVVRQLERMSEREHEVSEDPPPSVIPAANTVLIRDWHGTGHQVTILDRGVLYNKKNYRSLSQVAREITGSRWSGPLFFGLRSRPKERSGGTP